MEYQLFSHAGLTATPEFLGYRVFTYRDENVKLSLWDMPGSYNSRSDAAERVNERCCNVTYYYF